MHTFLFTLAVLTTGGLFSLLCCRQFNFLKTGYISITSIGCLAGLFTSIKHLQGTPPVTFSFAWQQLFTLSFTLDSLSAFFLVPIFAVCPLAALYSHGYMEKKEDAARVAASYFFYTLLIISMVLVAVADDIISFALCWELMSLSSLFLVLYDHERKTTRKAGYIYFIFTHIGALFIFAAFALAYSYSGSYGLASLGGLPENIKVIVFFLALVGFGSKAGIFPLHIWLPHAHPAAPSNISAVMSGVMIKIGIYAILRLYTKLEVSGLIFGETVLVLGIISGILGVVYALGKHDLKKLLAYHSVENIGIILIGAGIGMIGLASQNMSMAVFGFAGSLLHVLNHSIFKSLLFLGAGAVLHRTGVRQIDQLGGLMKRMPVTGKTFLIGSISISGLPPFNGFVSEFLIYYGAFHGLVLNGSTFILVMFSILALALIGGLAAACFSKVVGIVFLGEARSEGPAKAREAGSSLLVPMIILALLCLVIGIFPQPFINAACQGLQGMYFQGTLPMQEIDSISRNLAFAGRLSALLIGLSWLARKLLYIKKDVSQAPTWGCGFTQPSARMQYTGTSYAMSLVDFFRPLVIVKTHCSAISRIFPGRTTYTTHVEDRAETALNDLLVSPLLFLLGKLRWIQHGHIQLYIGYIIATIILLLLFI